MEEEISVAKWDPGGFRYLIIDVFFPLCGVPLLWTYHVDSNSFIDSQTETQSSWKQ